MFKLIIFIMIIICAGCKYPVEEKQNKKPDTIMQKLPVEQVIKNHSAEILAIPGVQGLYQGELENGDTCITVMVDKKTDENEKEIPKKLDGYPVVIEETGKIHPINK